MTDVESRQQPRAAVLTALRGLIMGLIGVFALLDPARALRLLVFVGGGLLLVDGVLELATTKFRAPRTSRFWLSLLRSLLSIIAGLIVLSSPVLIPMLTITFIVYFVGFQAILVGVISLAGAFTERGRQEGFWQSIVIACLYLAFGLALLLMPLSSAVVLTQVVALLMILYAIMLFMRALRSRSKGA